LLAVRFVVVLAPNFSSVFVLGIIVVNVAGDFHLFNANFVATISFTTG